MTQTTTVPVLPESAPFSEAQRGWLNGFFAGLVCRAPGAPVASQSVAAEISAPQPAEPVVEVEEEFPWHDPALSLDERITLADGKPKARVLMAAMAQLDCGACGYLCQSYAEAIANGKEKDLTRCAPGGSQTGKKLKELLAKKWDADQVVLPSEVRVKRNVAAEAGTGKHDRHNPYAARLVKCQPLNKAGSAKDTRLVAFDLKDSGLTYNVGDALGVYPENCPDSVQWLLDRLDASGAEEVTAPNGLEISLFEALLKHYQISRPMESMVELLAASATDPAHVTALSAMLAEGGPGIPEGHEIIDLLDMYPSARPQIVQFVQALKPLVPRLYSISSSLKAHPDQVHLTVGVVKYLNARQRQCKGVASTFMADRLRAGQRARVFVHPAHAFHLPASGDVPVIMIGPGTGIAPFRAFLQERQVTGAKGKNWLFFGDQRSDFDFLYREELEASHRDGLLTHLDTAFSRDQQAKVYVQDRMLQRASEIWDWLSHGAHIYVCGDAKRMAADVDAALRTIITGHGGLSEEAAEAYVKELTKAKRYQRDVY